MNRKRLIFPGNICPGDLLVSLYSELQASKAAANGTTSQDCHMAVLGLKPTGSSLLNGRRRWIRTLML